MKTAKQEAIEKAYGEYYNALQPYLDGDGWCFGSVKEINDIAFKFYNDENFQRNEKDKAWRPKSLKGIETNNFWIRIESEDDLPNEDIEKILFICNDKIHFGWFVNEFKCFDTGDFYKQQSEITHWKYFDSTMPIY